MIGALVAAVLLEIGKRTMGMYLENALSISQLYGSLGLVPLFMFWVYLMWLAVLFGMQVSSTLQHMGGRRLEELEERRHEFAMVDPTVVALVMRLVAQRFAAGDATTLEQIAETLDLPQGVVERLLNRLAQEGFIHRLSEPDGGIALSRPAESIPLGQLLDVAHEMAHRDIGDGAATALRERLRTAQREAAGDYQLASLLESPNSANARESSLSS
jgi:membrane protein